MRSVVGGSNGINSIFKPEVHFAYAHHPFDVLRLLNGTSLQRVLCVSCWEDKTGSNPAVFNICSVHQSCQQVRWWWECDCVWCGAFSTYLGRTFTKLTRLHTFIIERLVHVCHRHIIAGAFLFLLFGCIICITPPKQQKKALAIIRVR